MQGIITLLKKCSSVWCTWQRVWQSIGRSTLKKYPIYSDRDTDKFASSNLARVNEHHFQVSAYGLARSGREILRWKREDE
jgi:hypothetical protein